MADLNTLRTRLRQELHDEDSANYRWTNAELDRHLERAKREFSTVSPREQKTSLATTAGSRDLSISGLSDLVEVSAVEYPAGQYPPSYVRFSTWQTTLTMLIDSAPPGSQSVNVYWGTVHQLDGSGSSLPIAAEDVVVQGAGGYAALEWANFAINRINVSGGDAGRDYDAWGRAQLELFRRALRRFGKEARVRTSQLYSPGQEPAGKTTVQWP